MQDLKLRKIIVKTVKGYHFLPLNNIEYIQKLDDGTLFHLSNGKAVDCEKEFEYFASFLPQSGMYQVHDEHLVNVDRVVSFYPEHDFIETEGGDVVPTSMNHIQKVVELLKSKRQDLDLV